MKKPPKIYTTEKEILDAIDEKKKLADELSKLSLQLHSEKLLHYKNCYDFEEESKTKTGKLREALLTKSAEQKSAAEKCSDDGVRAIKRFKRLTEKTIPALSQALAAFRTETMPDILQEYKGVALSS